MPASVAPAPLRIAVIGLSGEEVGWTSQLAGDGYEVIVGRDMSALRAPGTHLGIVFATPAQAAELTPMLASQPATQPLALFVGRGMGEDPHPHAHLLKVLLDGKRQWERTFDAILDPIMVLDPRGRVIRANLQLARALDRDVRELHGQPYAGLLGPAVAGTGDRFSGEAVDPIAESLVDGQPRHAEARYERLSALHEITISALGRNEGGLVVILKDVSDRRDHQERMQRSGRLADIGQLAAGIAHEINTPLASISLRAESLMKSAQDPQLLAVESFKNFPRYLKTIDEEIFRCKKIIAALLDFSRARRPEVRDTDLNQLAEKAADLVGHQIMLKQVGLALELEPALPHVTADDGQMRQALLALLINALDATASGGQIKVSTARAENGMVALTVADTGMGIPPEHLDKIFTPFFTTKPVGQGTGLGLSACHGIVAAHGGEIRVDSEAGRGTRMTLLLPAARREGAA